MSYPLINREGATVLVTGHLVDVGQRSKIDVSHLQFMNGAKS